MNFNFKTFWNSVHDTEQRERAEKFVYAMKDSGYYSEAEAIAIVEKFQNQAFEDGELEESYNDSGEEA